jgi:hypothetical protein
MGWNKAWGRINILNNTGKTDLSIREFHLDCYIEHFGHEPLPSETRARMNAVLVAETRERPGRR